MEIETPKRKRGRPKGSDYTEYKKQVASYLDPIMFTQAKLLAASKKLPMSVLLRGFIEAGIQAAIRG